MCRCQQDNQNLFIQAAFNECIQNSSVQILGFVFGWLSITSWIICFIPQIRQNIIQKKGNSLTVLFLVQWILGDSSNVISCFLLDLSLTQKILSVYYLISCVVLLSQNYYYKYRKYNTQEQNLKVSKMEICIYLIILLYVITCILIVGFLNQKLIKYAPDNVNLCTFEDVNQARLIAGQVFGYITIPCYCLTRPTQIYHQWKKKSTERVNILMIILMLNGNLWYLLSIICLYYNDKNGLVHNIPFIIGSLFPFCCDIILLIQFKLYRNNQDNKLNLNKINNNQFYEQGISLRDRIQSLTSI